MDGGRVGGVHDLVDVGLDDLDAQPDQVDRLVITPVMLRGAAPKTAAAVSPGNASSSPSRNQSTNPWMPACRI
jgi:hypothetical protein